MVWCWWVLLWSLVVSGGTPKNILYIVHDDLRPWFNAGYGQDYLHTPNFDKLTGDSLVFRNAYCQQPVCAPSRNSWMTGRRPDTTKSWNFLNHFRQVGPDWISMPQYFKTHGYYTVGAGKLYHPGLPPNYDEPLSWSVQPYMNPPWQTCKQHYTYCSRDTPLETFEDWVTVNYTIAHMREAVKRKEPFFLGCGTHRPHAEYLVPKQFADLYPDTKPFPAAKHIKAPKGAPDVALIVNFGVKDATGTYKWDPVVNPVPEPEQVRIRRGYAAAVSWVDHLVGMLMAELETLGIADDTIVVHHADHGYSLGEQGEWEKKNLFENGARVPLTIRVPGAATGVTNALTELVDMYPTLAGLTGLPPPAGVEGTDLTPLFTNPHQQLKEGAFSQYPRCVPNLTTIEHQNCLHVNRSDFSHMGYTIRTTDWRYTAWLDWDGEKLVGEWGKQPAAVELYDHHGDPGTSFDDYENENVAHDPKNSKTVSTLHAMLEKQFNPSRQ